MLTRYQRLRNDVAHLAAPADAQVAYLDELFVRCTGGGSAAAYGNEEMALGLDDTLMASSHMMEFGEISDEEIAAVKSLLELFDQHWKNDDPGFWDRAALFDDPRWQDVRVKASAVLAQLPDAPRESDYTRELAAQYPDQDDAASS